MDRNNIALFYNKNKEGCWVWNRGISNGYGGIHINGKYRVAHRVVYELLKGPIPKNLTLDHLCRNRACINPNHLEPVTMKENILRGIGIAAVNARKTSCARSGHLLVGKNLYIWNGKRICMACNLENVKRYQAKAKKNLVQCQPQLICN